MKNIDPEFIIVIIVAVAALTGFGFLIYQDRELEHQEIMAAIKRCAE